MRAIKNLAMLFALALAVALPAWVGPGEHKETSAPVVWQEQYTGAMEPMQEVIFSRSALDSAWNRLFRRGGRPVPEVDFGKNVVACACLGERMTGGYGVGFGAPFERDGKLVIPYWEKVPTGFVTMALTQPCAMKVIERTEGQEAVMEKVAPPEKKETN
jgi:hypothetical protein